MECAVTDSFFLASDALCCHLIPFSRPGRRVPALRTDVLVARHGAHLDQVAVHAFQLLLHVLMRDKKTITFEKDPKMHIRNTYTYAEALMLKGYERIYFSKQGYTPW